ncbi:MAG: molecular chaperone [Spirochaetota bacterium]
MITERTRTLSLRSRGRQLRGLVVLILIALSSVAAHAFSFEPISQEFATTGPQANRVFRVTNTTNDRIAVRIAVRPRRIERDGTEIQGKESEHFIVYPRQMLLEPGEGRSVRVRWDGPAQIDAELPFRIIAEQLPVTMDEPEPAQGAAIRLTYRYEGSLYVIPPGAEPDVSVTSVARVERPDGEYLRVTISNAGTRHTLLSNAELTLSRDPDGEGDIIMRTHELQGLAGENMLAGSTRDFLVAMPGELWQGQVYAQIRFEAE